MCWTVSFSQAKFRAQLLALANNQTPQSLQNIFWALPEDFWQKLVYFPGDYTYPWLASWGTSSRKFKPDVDSEHLHQMSRGSADLFKCIQIKHWRDRDVAADLVSTAVNILLKKKQKCNILGQLV